MKTKIDINWDEWKDITEEEYMDYDCKETLMINDRGKCYYWKEKE